jgi:hypothetical protein
LAYYTNSVSPALALVSKILLARLQTDYYIRRMDRRDKLGQKDEIGFNHASCASRIESGFGICQ